MTPFILYQLKAGFCIMLFTGLYYLLFRRETFYRANRFYLTGSLIMSFILPLVHFPSIGTTESGAFIQAINSVTVFANRGLTQDAPEKINLLPLIYKIIASLFILHLLLQLIRLLYVVKKEGTIKIGSFRIISVSRRSQSFSFFNLIFISSSDNEEQNNQILQHEIAHASQLHSIDILLIQVIKTTQWFNPFIYLTEKALQETHEYLADEAVLEQDGDSGRYRLLLITQVFGVQPGIFSLFNYSLIKNRLTMMTKDKSPFYHRYRYLLVLPLLFAIGIILSCTDKENVPPPPPPPPPPPEISETITSNSAEVKDSSMAFVIVDEVAKFENGSIEDFRTWVQKNLVYPEDAIKNGIFGRVIVQFSVNSYGIVEEVKIIRGVSPMLDEETARVIRSSPKWTPAKLDGKNVKQQFVMPVIFQLQ